MKKALFVALCLLALGWGYAPFREALVGWLWEYEFTRALITRVPGAQDVPAIHAKMVERILGDAARQNESFRLIGNMPPEQRKALLRTRLEQLREGGSLDDEEYQRRLRALERL